VTFEVQTLHHDDMFRALYERECDFAVAYDPPSHPRMKRTTLAKGQLALLFREFAYPDMPERVSLDTLGDVDLIGLTSSGPLGDLLASELRRCGIRLHEVVSAQTFYIAAALARYGAGVAIVDEFTARASLSEGLAMRAIEPCVEFAVQCAYLEDRPPSSVGKKFIDLFRAVLAEGALPPAHP
jgi:DNA-binding transcriptional LysR family regulator